MGRGQTIGDWIAQIREEGLENSSNRYYSFYPACVADDNDPQQQGRSVVKVESLGFHEPQPLLSYPVSPYAGENFGFYFPPHKDSPVWVTFDHGDTHVARIHGSWWPNKNSSSDPRPPIGSHVPAEFVKSDGSAPTARGIKVKQGHGLIFEGDVTNSHVELWTGENHIAGTLATKHHRIRLDDKPGEEGIVITSFGGHKSTWRDVVGDVYVEHQTTAGHRILMDDTGQKILVETGGGNSITLNDVDQKISINTVAGQSLELSDPLQVIEAKTATGNTLTLDGTTLTNRILTTNGQILEQGITGTTVTDPGPVSVVAGGLLTMKGNGTTITSTGGSPAVQVASGVTNNSFTGLKKDTLLGGYTANITGVWSIVSASLVSIGSALVTLGSGAQFRLVNEQFFIAYNSHTHTSSAPGFPTGLVLTGQGIPVTHTTTQTTAA